MPARAFTGTNVFLDAVAQFDDHATALIGHNRWRTVGSVQNNANNHPVAMPGMLAFGTHYGGVLHADEFFRRFRLPRAAEVDSEVLFRWADLAIGESGIDPETPLSLVAHCRGRISAVLTVRGVPGQVVVLKGNKPLEFRYSRRYRAVAYATDAGPLDDAIAGCCPLSHDWRPMVVAPMTMLVFRQEDVFRPEAHRLRFVDRPRGRATVQEGAIR